MSCLDSLAPPPLLEASSSVENILVRINNMPEDNKGTKSVLINTTSDDLSRKFYLMPTPMQHQNRINWDRIDKSIIEYDQDCTLTGVRVYALYERGEFFLYLEISLRSSEGKNYSGAAPFTLM